MSSLKLKSSFLLFVFFVALLLVPPIISIGANQNSQKSDSKKRNFYVQPQPGSPLLIRDLSITIRSEQSNKPEFSTLYSATFYIENKSKKIVTSYAWEDTPEHVSICHCGGFDLTEFLPDESRLHKVGFTDAYGNGKSVVFRITSVKFEDGTEWKAAPFEPKTWKSQSKQAVRATTKIEKSVDTKSKETISKRVLAKHWWTSPVITDRISKTINGKQRIIGGITVQTKLHQLKREILDFVETCDTEQNNLEITHNTLDFAVDKFTTYEIKDRVFAYQIPYEFINAEDGHEIGAGNEAIYIDEEGNGNFKLLCNENREIESLPKWIKSLAGN
jgi:hypothetical protein